MTTWTPQNKNNQELTLTTGSPIGLLLALTYAITQTVPAITWSNSNKNSTAWTLQNKN
jgi:hypothetical protein